LEAKDKTNHNTESQPLGELLELRLRIAELEEAEARRRRVDKALRLSEKYFRTLIENTMDVITMLDQDGVITYQSPSTERVLGYGEEELLGKNILQYIHPADSAAVVERMARIVDSLRDLGPFRFRFRRKEGSWCDLEGTGKAILEGSELAGIIISSRDITRRKRTEQELRRYQERLEEMVLERTAELEKTNYLLRREIGERRQAELEKRQSEEYFQELFKNTQDLILVIGEDGRIRFINAAVKRMLGYEVEEMVGRDAYEQIHPDDIQRVIESQRDTDQPRTLEVRVRHKDGSWRWHEATETNLLEHAAVEGIVISTRDVTERKLAEEALRESEEKFRSITNAATDAILSLDDQGRITYMNRAGEKIFGYTSQEVVGQEMVSLFIPERFRDAYRMGMEEYIAAGEGDLPIKRMEIPGLRKDGTEFLAEVSISAFHIRGAWHFEALVRDITEQKEAEEALKESEERYRALVENANDVIYTVDTKGGIVYISPAIERISGYKAGELIGRNFLEFIHPDDQAERLSDFGATMQGRLQPSEFRLLDRDGSIRYVRTSSRPVVKDGMVVGLSGVMTDITERREAEESLERSERYFRSLIENARDIIAVLDAEGDVTYESPSVERVLGYKPGELLGKNVFEFVHPEDVPRVREVFSAGIQTPGTIEYLELRFAHADGSWRHLDVTGYNLLEDPSVGGVVINARDITERKEAEESLRDSEEKYRDLVENINDVILTLDKDGFISYISPVIEKVSGYSVEELLGRHYSEFVHPDDLPERLAKRERLLRGAEEPSEFRLVDKDGSIRFVRTSSHLRFKEGEMAGTVVVMTDISERMRAEEALRESEEKFRLISEQSIMGIIILQDDMVKYVNQAAADVFGYTVEEALAWGPKEFVKAIHPDDMPFVLEQIEKKRTGEPGAVANYITRIISGTGKVKWAEVYSKSVLFGGRKADLITIADVSERMRMQEELKGREEYFRSLIENASDVIVTVDHEGRVTYVSPSVERTLGFKPEELLGDVGFAKINPDDIFRAVETFKRILENPGRVYSVGLRVKHKNGTWRYIDVNVRNLLGHPSVQAIVANYRDITERKLMRERLESINHLFLSLGVDLVTNMESIMRAARDILGGKMAVYCRLQKGRFSLLTTAQGEDGLIVTRQPEGFVGYKVISADMDEPLVIEDLEASGYGEKDPLVRKYGLKSFVGYPVRTGRDQTMGCLGLFIDGARELSADELEILGMLARALSVEEERLSHEEGLKDFIDIASHELRHPVTLMKGYALTLRDFAHKMDEDARREALNVINDGAERLDLLVRELLNVSRIERGRFTMKKREADLKHLIERAVEEVREKGCEQRFEVSVSEGIGLRRVDEEKMVRVMVILLDNAVNHSPAGSTIELVAECRDGEALVSVLDRGVGVPEKERGLIFERFYQVVDALHHSTSGMGLGLYIAREIVESHGGKIWCEAREGGGSAFRFTIP